MAFCIFRLKPSLTTDCTDYATENLVLLNTRHYYRIRGRTARVKICRLNFGIISICDGLDLNFCFFFQSCSNNQPHTYLISIQERHNLVNNTRGKSQWTLLPIHPSESVHVYLFDNRVPLLRSNVNIIIVSYTLIIYEYKMHYFR